MMIWASFIPRDSIGNVLGTFHKKLKYNFKKLSEIPLLHVVIIINTINTISRLKEI